MIFAGLFALTTFFVAVLHYWDELFTAHANLSKPTAKPSDMEWEFHVPRDFLIWFIQGLLAPVLFWLLANANLIPGIPPFLAEVSLAQFSSA